jgi:transcriptional regulator with XRE-family HTH domain
MANPNQIRERLKKLRIERQISQATLAKALFVKNTTISNWENGTRSIHLEALHQISEYFNVPLTYFTEVSGFEVTKKNIITNKSVLTASAVIALIVSSGVMLATRNPAIAIDACYGQIECYLINDPEASVELASKNIAGGLMTNVELTMVYEFLESYIWKQEDELQNINYRYVVETYLSYFNYDRSLYDDETYYQFMKYFTDDEMKQANHFLRFQTINQDNKQMVVLDGVKHILYKTGFEQFIYEVYADAIYRFTIDLKIEALYLGSEKIFRDLENTLASILTIEASNTRHWSNGETSYHHWMPKDDVIHFGTIQSNDSSPSFFGMQAHIYDVRTASTYTIEYSEAGESLFFLIRKNEDYFAFPYLSITRTTLASVYEGIKNFNYVPDQIGSEYNVPFDELILEITPYFDEFDFSMLESSLPK